MLPNNLFPRFCFPLTWVERIHRLTMPCLFCLVIFCVVVPADLLLRLLNVLTSCLYCGICTRGLSDLLLSTRGRMDRCFVCARCPRATRGSIALRLPAAFFDRCFPSLLRLPAVVSTVCFPFCVVPMVLCSDRCVHCVYPWSLLLPTFVVYPWSFAFRPFFALKMRLPFVSFACFCPLGHVDLCPLYPFGRLYTFLCPKLVSPWSPRSEP